MKKFLIIQTAFIGDVILSTPLIEKLHEHYPDARIDFLLRKGNETLLENHPYLNKLWIWDKKNKKYGKLRKLSKAIHNTGYHTVINLQRYTSSGLFTIFSGAEDKIGFDKNPLSFLFTKKVKHSIKEGRHETERNLELIRDLTDDLYTPPRLYPSKEDEKQVGKYKEKPYICIAPASVWFTKQFPEEKWIALLKQIKQYKVYLLGSPDDKPLAEKIKRECSHPEVENLCGDLSLLQSAALMKNAVMNYCNDSAPLHLASAVNAPVTAIFCSTIPEFGFGPLSENSTIVETPETLDCRPCGIHGKKACPLGHFKCAYNIPVENLLAPLKEGR